MREEIKKTCNAQADAACATFAGHTLFSRLMGPDWAALNYNVRPIRGHYIQNTCPTGKQWRLGKQVHTKESMQT